MKKYLKYLIGLLIIGMASGAYMYYKPHQNIKASQADEALSATEVFAAFEADESAANTQFLDKIVAVSGQVLSVNKDAEGIVSITLDAGKDMFGVICQLDQLSRHPREEFSVGETVSFKGICTGMLMDVVFVRCVEIE